MPELKLTPTERRIYDLLGDGYGHTKAELAALLDDEYTDTSIVKVHVSNLRKKLKAVGEDIVCVLINVNSPRYRRVRTLLPEQITG